MACELGSNRAPELGGSPLPDVFLVIFGVDDRVSFIVDRAILPDDLDRKMLRKAGHDPAGMDREGPYAVFGPAPIGAQCEKRVRRFSLGIGEGRIIGPRGEVRIVEIDPTVKMAARRERDDPRPTCGRKIAPQA